MEGTKVGPHTCAESILRKQAGSLFYVLGKKKGVAWTPFNQIRVILRTSLLNHA